MTKKTTAKATAKTTVKAPTKPKVTETPTDVNDAIVNSAFGHKNRLRLLNEYFAVEPTRTPAMPAWAHVYRLLLWTDQTTGLAHCYESDKAQPGKPWYARSLAFHDWISNALGTPPAKITEQIDWMFQKAASELAAEVVRKAKALSELAARQRAPFEGKGLPSPGEDPELVAIVKQVLGEHIVKEPSPEKWRELVQRIRQYLTLDNKRKNLLGNGFEDVLGTLVERSCPSVKVYRRRPLPELPGFNPTPKDKKPIEVDLAIIRPKMRTLVTAKWSVRADREKQFVVDYTEYIKANSEGKAFDYVFVTNEFDPARLMRACDNLASGNSQMFTHVVHISTDALRATYGSVKEESMRKVLGFIDTGRLISLDNWLQTLK